METKVGYFLIKDVYLVIEDDLCQTVGVFAHEEVAKEYAQRWGENYRVEKWEIQNDLSV